MCACRVPEAIAARPIQPKLGASVPPVVLVMTRPWYAGPNATCAPEGSLRSSTWVCCRRKAMSDSKRLTRAGATVRSTARQPPIPRHTAPSIASRFLQRPLLERTIGSYSWRSAIIGSTRDALLAGP